MVITLYWYDRHISSPVCYQICSLNLPRFRFLSSPVVYKYKKLNEKFLKAAPLNFLGKKMGEGDTVTQIQLSTTWHNE